VSLVAATVAVAKADREAASAAAVSSSKEESTQTVQKPVAAAKPAAAKITVSADCQTAIDKLKALREADVQEDVTERLNKPLTPAAIAADREEDLGEAQKLRDALTAVRAACLPQPSAACQAAIAALQALLPANLGQEWGEWMGEMHAHDNQVKDLTALRAAFAAVKAACGHRD
jgi:biopolymer transport protein ExbD